jgi:hypothetical protein
MTGGAYDRLQEISRTLDELATSVEGLAQQLAEVVGELRADDLPAEEPVHLPERRSGSDRRTGLERRRVQPEGLAARVFGAIDRRRSADRRAGAGRRSSDLPAADEGSAAGSQDDAAPGVVRQG